LEAIVRDIAAHRYSKTETTAFVVACAAFMTTEEVLNLTKAMTSVGSRLTWAKDGRPPSLLLDKHCIGGIPGNRTSMIVVPIVAAHGLPIPKTSSRAITSPAGTADTMEVLANVDLSLERMRAVVDTCNGCLVWGGHANLSPADDIMINVERPLAIDTPEQLVASIMSKKAAAGSTHLVIDIPLGSTAKIRTQAEAARLRKLFEYIGDALGIQIRVVVTDGSQPIGRGIGPVLEARDVMAVLRNEPNAPADLRERSLELAGRLLDFDPALPGGGGKRRAEQILQSGQALAKMEQIIAAQGPPSATVPLGHLTQEVCADRAGIVNAIDCFRLARIARLAGAPISKGAGIDVLKKIGDRVRPGEPLYRIHAALETDFGFATDMAKDMNGYVVG
jgi:thymidine phosphorylase